MVYIPFLDSVLSRTVIIIIVASVVAFIVLSGSVCLTVFTIWQLCTQKRIVYLCMSVAMCS